MQITTTVKKKENSWLISLGIGLGVVVGTILFGLIIVRMGFMNGILNPGDTAVSLPPNTLLYTTREMRFGQTELHVPAGQEITLRLQNFDLYTHSFDIDALNLHVEMPANGQVSTTFTAPNPGIYQIYCGVPGHKEAGMIATLVVEP